MHYPLLHCLFGTAYKLFKSLGRLREAETSDGEGLEPPQLEIGDQGQRQEGAGQDAASSRKARKVPSRLPKMIELATEASARVLKSWNQPVVVFL